MLHFVFVGSHPPILSNSQCLKGFSLILGLIHFYTFRFTPYMWQVISCRRCMNVHCLKSSRNRQRKKTKQN